MKINFQPAGSEIPEGYVIDDGSPYGQPGGSGGGELEDPLEYGWRSP